MRYYGMTENSNNNQNTNQNSNQSQSAPDYQEALPQVNQPPSESRTFNRTEYPSGLYEQQRARNVRPINEWLEMMPPAVMPPGNNPNEMNFENATVYEYPANQNNEFSPMQNSSQNKMHNNSCPVKMDFYSYLCTLKGKLVRISHGGTSEYVGILKTIGNGFVVLQNQNNQLVMIAKEYIHSISFE